MADDLPVHLLYLIFFLGPQFSINQRSVVERAVIARIDTLLEAVGIVAVRARFGRMAC